MDTVFLKLLNMSITASWLIFAVLILRFLLRKAPKWISCLLWGLVAIRLIFPFSIESVFSLIPNTEPISNRIISGSFSQTGTEIMPVTLSVTESAELEEHPLDAVSAPSNQGNRLFHLLGIIWLTGTCLLILYSVISYYRLLWCTDISIPIRDNVLKCDTIDTPFILGLFRPRIYLPSGMEDTQMEYVIAHERAHIRRLDHWWKPLGFLILSVYWFRPLCWISYILFCRDIELACDEQVIKSMDLKSKKSYAEALLSCSIKQRLITACPLAFGEIGVKERIRSVLNYKRPAFWIIWISVLACIVVSVCFLTNPSSNDSASSGETGYVMPGINVPSEVLEAAERYVETEYNRIQGTLQDYNYSNWRIEHLDYSYTYDNLDGKLCELYQLNYEFLSSSPEQVVLVGGMSMSEDGWTIPGYPNSTYLVFENTGGELSFLCSLFENDYFPGDEIFTEDLWTAVENASNTGTTGNLSELTSTQEAVLLPFLRSWAQAFVNRDGTVITSLASSEVITDFLDRELLIGSNGQYSFGLSSPWPWSDSTDFSLNQYDSEWAEIYYYARTSDPHIICWKETLSFEWMEDRYVITGEQLTFYDHISSGAEFLEAYGGQIDGTMIDYTQNDLGKTLNNNALLSSSNLYQPLFTPESAAVSLLNLSTDSEKVQISRYDQDSSSLNILFLEDQTTITIRMIQPYGENGIWVPANDRVDVLTRFSNTAWAEVETLTYSDDVPDLSGILCIGEIPEYKIKAYGYNDAEIMGQGIAIQIADDVNYFDWIYTTSRAILPDFYWDENKKQLQISFHTYTGTGVAAEHLYVLQQYDTGTLHPSDFSMNSYSDLASDRIGYRFNEETRELTLIDQETKQDLSSVKVSGSVTGLEIGSISGFGLGETIRFSVTPGYYLDDGFIAEYEDMPTLDFEVLMEQNDYGEISFDLGSLY